jgi:hypothetical protein
MIEKIRINYTTAEIEPEKKTKVRRKSKWQH